MDRIDELSRVFNRLNAPRRTPEELIEELIEEGFDENLPFAQRHITLGNDYALVRLTRDRSGQMSATVDLTIPRWRLIEERQRIESQF